MVSWRILRTMHGKNTTELHMAIEHIPVTQFHAIATSILLNKKSENE